MDDTVLDTFGDFQDAVSGVTQHAAASPDFPLDLSAYAPLLEDEDLTDTERDQLLELLWTIIVEFVAMGFHAHPVEAAQTCGQEAERHSERPIEGSDLLHSGFKDACTRKEPE